MIEHFPYTEGDIWNIGRMIAALETANATHSVYIDWNMLRPRGVESYRGNYSDLALEFEIEGSPPNVTDVLGWLTDAKGKIFRGYKGGNFQMSADTRVWVANYGECAGVGVVGMFIPDRSDQYSHVKILTGVCNDLYKTG